MGFFNQEAAVFVLHKKNLEAYPKKDRDLIVDAFKKGATQLARIKHPRILSLQHQLEESKYYSISLDVVLVSSNK